MMDENDRTKSIFGSRWWKAGRKRAAYDLSGIVLWYTFAKIIAKVCLIRGMLISSEKLCPTQICGKSHLLLISVEDD